MRVVGRGELPDAFNAGGVDDTNTSTIVIAILIPQDELQAILRAHATQVVYLLM